MSRGDVEKTSVLGPDVVRDIGGDTKPGLGKAISDDSSVIS